MRISDWSSDVCSSDLADVVGTGGTGGTGGAGAILCLCGRLDQLEVVGVAAVPAAHGAGGERQFGVRHHARGIEELRDAQAVAEIGRASCRERVCQYV